MVTASTTGVSQFETGHQDTVHDAQFDYYGKLVATCSSDRLVKVFSVNGKSVTHSADLVGHQGPVWQISWSHPKNGAYLASCGFDGTILIWHNATNDSIHWQQVHQITSEGSSSVNSVAWAPYEMQGGNKLVAGACADGSILIAEQDQQQWVTSVIPHAHAIGATGVSWAPVLGQAVVKRCATCGCDGMIKVWVYDHTSQSWVQEGGSLAGHQDWVRSVAWAPAAGLNSSATMVSAGEDGKVIVWKHNGHGWKETVVHHFDRPVWKASWSHNGSMIAVTDAEQQVSLWKDVGGGQYMQIHL